jgi:sulfite reductase (NADPH) hemoprotein beta-component
MDTATQIRTPSAAAEAGIYHYDALDHAFITRRVEAFREQVQRRLSGALSEDEFKPLRLMNGLYLQLHAYMLRVAIPYGVLSAIQMRKLAHVARKYDRDYGHFTTRQNIQFNWIKLEQAPDILAELAEVDIHAIQTSGNCIRNVSTDQFAGAAADELVDPRVYAEILRQWSTDHPEFLFLPRKFKIAIIGSPQDRAAIKLHDIGILTKRNAAGEPGFTIYVGGGLGRTPVIGSKIRDWLPVGDLLRYMEAVLRVYNAAGRRDNIYKARIKILVRETGAERFAELVEQEFANLSGDRFHLPAEVVAAIQSRFGAPDFADLPAVSPAYQKALAENADFARWVSTNTHPHRVPGYISAVISLKPIGGIPGDATSAQIDRIADLAEQYSFGELRIAHEQNVVLAHVRQDALFSLWRELEAPGIATPNVGLITDIIACPGLDYCDLANARSIPIAQSISERFGDLDRQHDIGELHVNISGCINACAHHHVGHIGILGVDKHGAEAYQITLGGTADENAALGQLLGAAVAADEVPDVIEGVIRVYLAVRLPGELFIDSFRRVGLAPFKQEFRDGQR